MGLLCRVVDPAVIEILFHHGQALAAVTEHSPVKRSRIILFLRLATNRKRNIFAVLLIS